MLLLLFWFGLVTCNSVADFLFLILFLLGFNCQLSRSCSLFCVLLAFVVLCMFVVFQGISEFGFVVRRILLFWWCIIDFLLGLSVVF